MKERKTKRKAGPSNPPPPLPPGAVAGNPIKILTETVTVLKNENNELRGQFKQLVEMLDKKFEVMDQADQQKLAQVRTQQVEPQQESPGSEGLLNKKIGDTTIGEALTSLGHIASAWRQQSAMDQNQSGMQSMNDLFVTVGRSVFEKFVNKEGLGSTVAETVEETTSGIG